MKTNRAEIPQLSVNSDSDNDQPKERECFLLPAWTFASLFENYPLTKIPSQRFLGGALHLMRDLPLKASLEQLSETTCLGEHLGSMASLCHGLKLT